MQQIVIDLTPSGLKAVCYASQYDVGRSIRFALRDKGQVYTLAGTETITLKMRKPDGTERTENITNTSSSYVDLVTSRDTCDMSGEYECELRFANGDVDIGSGNFIMQVEADAFDGLITIKTASGAIASFETSLPFPLQEAKFTLPYRAEGYTELTHFNSKTTPVIDETPYQTRINSNIGNLALEKLVGVSCVFNQLVQNGNFESTTGWQIINGTISVSNNVARITCDTAGDMTLKPLNITTIANHKYLVLVDCLVSAKNVLLSTVYVGTEPRTSSTSFTQLSIISYRASDITAQYPQLIMQNAEIGDYFEVKNFMCIDLTAMFGSEVADYLYGLENS